MLLLLVGASPRFPDDFASIAAPLLMQRRFRMVNLVS